MSGHAIALAACDRGVQQAEKDFARGRSLVNPFLPSSPMQRAGWDGRMRALLCQRDHGVDLCCQEHRQHRSQTFRSFQGLSCCADCAAEVIPRMEAEHSRLATARHVSGESSSRSALHIPRQRLPES